MSVLIALAQEIATLANERDEALARVQRSDKQASDNYYQVRELQRELEECAKARKNSDHWQNKYRAERDELVERYDAVTLPLYEYIEMLESLTSDRVSRAHVIAALRGIYRPRVGS